MGDGLKQQWGVNDPKKAGSDKQAKEFQAAFQRAIGCINGHLQYTSANAEAARHNPLEARRDALYTAFQSALAQIDPANPAKAKGAIDKVLGDAKALESEVAKFHAEALKAKNDWMARQPKFDAAVHQIEELEAWGDGQAPALRTLVDGIRANTNERRYAPASATTDQLLPKLKPIYDNYVKQKAAKPKYEQQMAEQTARLEPPKSAERPSQPMTAKSEEIEMALQQANTKASAKDYVGGLEQLKTVHTGVDALEKMTNDPERVNFLTKSKAVEALINTPADTTFKSLEADWNALLQLREQASKTGDAGDYKTANTMLADFEKKYAAYKTKLEELKKQKQEYDALAAELQPGLTEALKSTFKSLKPRLDEITKGKGEMEAAAQKEDFAAALKSANDLKTKVSTFLPDLTKMQEAEKQYTTAWTPLKSKLDDALVQANDFADLKPQRAELVAGETAIETAASAEEFDKTLPLIKDLGPKADAYLTAAKAEQDAYVKKGEDIKKQLDDAGYMSRDDVAREIVHKLKPEDIEHLPTEVRNRLLTELQDGSFSDEDKAACKKLFSVKTLDPEFEKMDQANRQKMIEKIKSDPAFKDARDRWDKMTDEERVAIMQKAADIQADVYGIPKTKVDTYDKNDGKDFGYYDHKDGILHINKNDKALKGGGFDEAIDTAVHENGHRYQATLVDKLNAGEIKPGDPLYNQAMTFKLNDKYYIEQQKKGQRSTPDNGPEYFTQPQENHSRITGAAVKSAGIGK